MNKAQEELKRLAYDTSGLDELVKLISAAFNPWISVKERFPKFEDGIILIYYERDGKDIIETGYLCGEELIKGQTERYPYPDYWMYLPKPPRK